MFLADATIDGDNKVNSINQSIDHFRIVIQTSQRISFSRHINPKIWVEAVMFVTPSILRPSGTQSLIHSSASVIPTSVLQTILARS